MSFTCHIPVGFKEVKNKCHPVKISTYLWLYKAFPLIPVLSSSSLIISKIFVRFHSRFCILEMMIGAGDGGGDGGGWEKRSVKEEILRCKGSFYAWVMDKDWRGVGWLLLSHLISCLV